MKKLKKNLEMKMKTWRIMKELQRSINENTLGEK